MLFGACTGQRSMATMMKLTVGQFRQALQLENPVVQVKASQDKIRMEHYVPLHPEVVKALQPLLDGRAHPLPEYVYDVYMQYWKDVHFFQ